MSAGKLALFDFDGTITHKDTLAEFVIFTKGRWRYYGGLIVLAPVLLLFKAGLMPNWRAKESVLSFFFGGMLLEEFERKCNAFAQERIPQLLRRKALAKIDEHLEEGYRVVVVSASPENWVKPWATSRKLECIATRLEVVDGRITGRIAGKNCHGPEKVTRIVHLLDLSGFTEIHTYGDSHGDLQMLELGTSRFYRPFRNK